MAHWRHSYKKGHHMATIRTRMNADGNLVYHVQVRMKGHPAQTATFKRLTDTRRWAQRTESDIREGRHFPGELLFKQARPDTSQAETCFRHALDVARHQQDKSWGLRAATSLARLWQSRGKRQAAYGLLAPVYEWFTEGFDTADLQDAKASLDALGDA
jgi:predicted ATPase